MENKLERKYGLFTAICMVVGIVIGSGVFFKAQTILQKTEGNMPLGILAWVIGGLIMLSRVNSAQPTTGIGYEMDVMTAVILGGVSLAGGSGSVIGTIIGVMIIGVLNNGLTLVGASEYVKMVLEGIALLLALCIEPISRAVMSARKK